MISYEPVCPFSRGFAIQHGMCKKDGVIKGESGREDGMKKNAEEVVSPGRVPSDSEKRG